MSIFIKTTGLPTEAVTNYYVELQFNVDDFPTEPWAARITQDGWDGDVLALLGQFATKQEATAAASAFIRDTIATAEE